MDVSGRGAASVAKLGLEVYPPIQNLGDLNLVVFLRPIIYLAFTTWPFVYCLKKLSLTIVVPFSKASLSCFFCQYERKCLSQSIACEPLSLTVDDNCFAFLYSPPFSTCLAQCLSFHLLLAVYNIFFVLVACLY